MSETEADRIAVVTGANRGIGFEICKQLMERGVVVYFTAREMHKATEALERSGASPDRAFAAELDVARDESVAAFAERLQTEQGRLDILINNAAANFDFEDRASTVELAKVRETFETNLFGPWRCVQALLPLLERGRAPRIVNVSSEAGASFSSPGGMRNMGGRIPAYGLSKTALNALTIKLAADLGDTGITVNSVCPGLTATTPAAAAMGGRPTAEGAASVVQLALMKAGDPTGGFFRDGAPLQW